MVVNSNLFTYAFDIFLISKFQAVNECKQYKNIKNYFLIFVKLSG